MSDEDNVDYDIDEDSDEEAIIERQRLKRKQMLYRLQREENYGLSTKKEQEPVKPIMKFVSLSEVSETLDPTQIISVVDCVDKPLTRNRIT